MLTPVLHRRASQVARLTGLHGLGPVGRKGLKDLVRFAEAKEQLLASVALDCIDAAYVALDGDIGKLFKASHGSAAWSRFVGVCVP
jgi:hypothetical protein